MESSVVLEQLQAVFKYDHFKLGQKEIIEDVLANKDVLGILPTGSGKSLCYQLPATLLPGITLVVSPLISLMVDQVRQVKAFYFKEVVAIHSGLDYKQRSDIIAQLASYKLVYVSPELLQQSYFINKLKEELVSLFVVDEAHCISQWGYDFRLDYLRLKDVIKSVGNPVVMALSGTATPEVQIDITKKLGRREMNLHVYPMDRENIALVVQKVADQSEKDRRLVNLLQTYHIPTLIYFSSRKEAERISEKLQRKLATKRISFYHGGMSASDRLTVQQQFMHDQIDIICCTNAFGMGINKGNIHLVIHYHLPTQLEGFIQEIGRAGRNGGESVSIVLHSPDDIKLPRYIINNELPTEKELQFTFKVLLQLYKQNASLPQKADDIAKMLQVKPFKWRFIAYHLENAELIIDEKITYDKVLWREVYEQILRLSEKRRRAKEEKLNEIMLYLETDLCLRVTLYSLFQDEVKFKTEQCCTNCSFSFDKWKLPVYGIQASKNQGHQPDWEQLLEKLLLVGENR